MNAIKKYDAHFTFDAISEAQKDVLAQIFERQGLEVDLFEDALEFSFKGRDLSDYVLSMFIDFANVVGYASGELQCEIDDDDSQDPRYAFFRIRDHKLWRQEARLVRSDSIAEVQWDPPQKSG